MLRRARPCPIPGFTRPASEHLRVVEPPARSHHTTEPQRLGSNSKRGTDLPLTSTDPSRNHACRSRSRALDIPRIKPKSRRNVALALAGLALVVITTVGLSQLQSAAPEIERSTLLVDAVRRGEMRRDVRGNGTLVPESQRLVAALTAGRVERVLARPGTAVEAATVLIELSNPDVQLEALDAERQLKLAEADLAIMRANLETARLGQQSALAASRTEKHEAERGVAVAARLEQGRARLRNGSRACTRSRRRGELALRRGREAARGRDRVAQGAARAAALRGRAPARDRALPARPRRLDAGARRRGGRGAGAGTRARPVGERPVSCSRASRRPRSSRRCCAFPRPRAATWHSGSPR